MRYLPRLAIETKRYHLHCALVECRPYLHTLGCLARRAHSGAARHRRTIVRAGHTPLWGLLVYTRHVHMHMHAHAHTTYSCVHVQAVNKQGPRVSKAVSGWGIRSACV